MMPNQGCTVLVLLAFLAAPISAARPSLSDVELNLEGQIGTQDDNQSSAELNLEGQIGTQDDNQSSAELNLEGQIGTQDDNQSSAAFQEGTQVQDKSLARTPTTERIRLASASAAFGTTAYGAFATGAAITSAQSIGAMIIMKGVSIWQKQLEIEMIYGFACDQYMKMKAWGPNGKSGEAFQTILQRIWGVVFVPALIREGSEGGDPEETQKLVTSAQNFLLYTEAFLAVGAYIRAHPTSCPSHLTNIQWSWNQVQDAYDLAYNSRYKKKEFHLTNPRTGDWNPADYPVWADRETTMSAMKSEMETSTEWSIFRWTSAIDRIVGVAKSLGLYNEEGQLIAPYRPSIEEPMMPVKRSTQYIQGSTEEIKNPDAWAFWNAAM